MVRPEWVRSLLRVITRQSDCDPANRTVEATNLEVTLYFEVDRLRFESHGVEAKSRARAETAELAAELADDPHIQEVETDRYCPTPTLTPIFGDVVELAFTTGTTITLGVLSNLLYEYLKEASGVSHLEIGTVRVPLSDDMDRAEFKQKLDDAWDELDD